MSTDFRKLCRFSSIAGVENATNQLLAFDVDASMRGCNVSLRVQDGHRVDAYDVEPRGRKRGGIVVLQEIFGVTSHIRSVCDDYAERGYHVVAPSLFDRIGKGLVLGYSKEDAARGREWRSKIPWVDTEADVLSAVHYLREAGKTATVGYCWGGTVSWRCASYIDLLAAAVCYYPTQIAGHVEEQPRCPVLMHFGESDPIATIEHARLLRASHDQRVDIQLYSAGHGFNCDEISGFHAPSAELALRRTLDFLNVHLD